jgi:hypothetical protein
MKSSIFFAFLSATAIAIFFGITVIIRSRPKAGLLTKFALAFLFASIRPASQFPLFLIKKAAWLPHR